MNDSLLEDLLNEEESATLDFKRDQYAFVGATEGEKSELLKDILAFANAWRRATAFILVGVEEIKGGRSRVVGVSSHLNDNDLQQFVNSKTNRPLIFSYHAYPFQGFQVGVIEIPEQIRPVFLRKNFGRLAKDVVYLRRGSSTFEADPDEIAQMGAATVAAKTATPSLDIEWANTAIQQRLGPIATMRSTALVPRLTPEAFRPADAGSIFSQPLLDFDAGYYRDLIDYVHDATFLNPLGFVVENTGAVLAENVVAKCRIEREPGLRIHDFHGKPDRPSPHALHASLLANLGWQRRAAADPLIVEYPTHWELSLEAGRLPPKATVWTTDVIWIGSERSSAVVLAVQLFAENLSTPTRKELTVQIQADARKMSLADFPRD